MKLNDAQKASRKMFKEKFGANTAAIIFYAAKGWTSERIATKVGVSIGSVRSTRGNHTRGIYSPYVDSTFKGTCAYT